MADDSHKTAGTLDIASLTPDLRYTDLREWIDEAKALGEVRQVHLRGPSDWPVIALALQSQSQGLREGQSLTFSVPPELVVVLQGKYAIPKPG